MGRLMSDAEIRRRKKLQGHVSQATGALGLAALGGTLAASRGGRNTLRRVPALKAKIKKPPPKDPNRDKIKGGVMPVLATSAGLGGISSFNFAAYTNAEARKRKAAVVKSLDIEPVSGEEGLAKNWEPSASRFDPEGKRMQRAEDYPKIAAGVAGASAGAAGLHALSATGYKGDAKKIKPTTQKLKEAKQATRGRAKVMRGRSGKLAALSAGATGTAVVLNRKKNSESWRPHVSKSMEIVSAFGVEHD